MTIGNTPPDTGASQVNDGERVVAVSCMSILVVVWICSIALVLWVGSWFGRDWSDLAGSVDVRQGAAAWWGAVTVLILPPAAIAMGYVLAFGRKPLGALLIIPGLIAVDTVGAVVFRLVDQVFS